VDSGVLIELELDFGRDEFEIASLRNITVIINSYKISDDIILIVSYI
jgi:hypothetical protein